MFSEQMASIASALVQLGMSEQIVSCFVDTLGNCQSALEHRGPVTFSGPDPPNAGQPGVTEGYALNVSPGSTANIEGNSIFAGDNTFTGTSNTTFDGPVNLNGDNTFTGTNNFDGDTNFGGDVNFDGSVTGLPSGGGGVLAYGGLLLDSSQTLTDNTYATVAFNLARPVLGMTATTGASAKLTVTTGGKYMAVFNGGGYAGNTGNQDVAIIFELRVNGSAVSPLLYSSTDRFDPQTIADGDIGGGDIPSSGRFNVDGFNGIIDLANGDAVSVRVNVNLSPAFIQISESNYGAGSGGVNTSGSGEGVGAHCGNCQLTLIRLA